MLKLLLLFQLLSLQAFAACPQCGSLEIKVAGIKSNNGLVRIILSKDKENFEAHSPAEVVLARAYFRNTKANTKGITFQFPELPSGNTPIKFFTTKTKTKF